MKLIESEKESFDTDGILPQVAHDRLESYVRYKKRFPITADFQLLRHIEKTQKRAK